MLIRCGLLVEIIVETGVDTNLVNRRISHSHGQDTGQVSSNLTAVGILACSLLDASVKLCLQG